MNLCKRAFLYSIRKKGKTLTLLAFLLVMATLMLTCFSIQSATETANANIKKALLGYFTINGKQLEGGITEEVREQILGIDGLSGRYTLRSYPTLNIVMHRGILLKSTRKRPPRYRKAMNTLERLWQIQTHRMTATLRKAGLN